MRAFAVSAGLILLLLNRHSVCGELEVTPDPGTTVIFRTKAGQASGCSICEGGGLKNCNTGLTLSKPQTTVVNFNCSEPGNDFTVEINQDIDCMSKTCSNTEAIHPDSTRFLDFTRIFTWDLKVQPDKSVQLDFPAPGMRQISPSESCPDQHTYTIISYQRTGPLTIGTFCRNGTINSIKVLYKCRVSLEVLKGTDLNPSDFKVSIGPGTQVLVELDIKMPLVATSADFYSPSYSAGFFTESKIKWNFDVEPVHNSTVLFQKYVAPECQQKAVAVEYTMADKTSLSLSPTDVQPASKQGDFSLTLINCDAKKGVNVPGLSLYFNVEVVRSGTPYLCAVDLQNEKGLSLQIENKDPSSFCQMTVDSMVQETIKLPEESKATLSFLDCPEEDLLVTALQTIDLGSGLVRDVSSNSLGIPSMPFSLPSRLQEFTWLLLVPGQSSVFLSLPSGNLLQSTPQKACDQYMSLLVSQTNDAIDVGRFCSVAGAPVQKVQIRGNVSITATSLKDLSDETKPILKVSTSQTILETMIYFISPPVLASTYLTTPDWPDAMDPFLSATWIVSIPAEYQATVQFTNLTRPACESGQASIQTGPLDSNSEVQSWREDEAVPSTLTQTRSFYINVSNCQPSGGSLAALATITLRKQSRKILPILLAVTGALLTLLLIALVVVCVVKKKKTQKMNRSSVLMPKGAPFLPGNVTFPKTRPENDSHVYEYIDERDVYAHLQDNSESNGHPVDTYRAFTGPSDPARLTPPRPRSPLLSQSSLGFVDRRMVDNELYTFKTFGDGNANRLSSDTSRLQPQVEPDDSFSDHDSDED